MTVNSEQKEQGISSNDRNSELMEQLYLLRIAGNNNNFELKEQGIVSNDR